MTNEEIKSECELQYKQIKDSHDRLSELRSLCKHEHTFEGLWEWRVGSTYPATICSYCGTCVKGLTYIIPDVVTNT